MVGIAAVGELAVEVELVPVDTLVAVVAAVVVDSFANPFP